jgi:outer membrane receptor for ferrienterochelin and colicins
MRTSLPVLLLFVCVSLAFPQGGAISGRVLDRGGGLPGANVVLDEGSLGASTGEDGRFLLQKVPAGPHILTVSIIGYADAETLITVAADTTLELELLLVEEHAEMEEVVVTGTRTVRSIADVPVRVEVIPEEEVEEKLLMSPASIAMLLNESTGMRVQTTSGASNTANLRIQGLSGRYTQLLTDGIPNFGGLSSGFSITQVPPLNLRQVEVIKGATSTLYGPDAISGVVNFLTKTPPDEGAGLSALANATTAGGYDAAFFRGERTSAGFGYTLLASGNWQDFYDADGDAFADIADYSRFSVSPQFFFTPGDGADARAGFGFMAEDRKGGWTDGTWPASGPPPYTESISTRRWDASIESNLRLPGGRSVGVKFAGARVERDATYGTSPFNGTQDFLYGDIQFVQPIDGGHTLLAGAAFALEDFTDQTPGLVTTRSYSHRTPGVFAQGEAKLGAQWSALAGLRADFQNVHGAFVTPRLSVKYSPSAGLTLRVGGGTGFKAPTIFVEEAEEIGFKNVRPVTGLDAERAASGSFDVNWGAVFNEDVSFSVNAAFYLSRLANTLVTDNDSLTSGGEVEFRNSTGPLLARGGEVSVKTGYRDFKLFLGYTYLYATRDDLGLASELSLNPRHSAGAVLFYENGNAGLKVGFETYWTGRQRLERNPYRDVSPDYFLTGVVAEKAFGAVRLFVNFENIFDTRQTRWDPIVAGGYDAVSYRPVPVYAPLEGRVVNGGVRVVL